MICNMLYYILGATLSVTVIGSTLFLMAVNNAYGVPLYENIKQLPDLLLTSIQLLCGVMWSVIKTTTPRHMVNL